MDADRESLASESRALQAALRRFPTRRDWLASAEGPALAARLERHLSVVRRFAPAAVSSEPPSPARRELRIVQWNVLHGERFEGLLQALRVEPKLAGADLVALQETDLGLWRSGNRDVAFDLARELGLHAAWTPLFLELEGGRTRSERGAPEEGESLFGLALLSRFPLGDVRQVPLVSPEALLFDRERKAGRFVALVARVHVPAAPVTAIVAHLDVHGSPRRRLEQMLQLLGAVPPGPAILAGDLNTTTLSRGGLLHSLRTLAVLALAPRARLRARLLAPHRPEESPREPLFTALRDHGFEVLPFNDESPSLDLRFADVHELDRMPAPLRHPVLALLGAVERRNVLRLDWIAARGFVAASELPPFALPHLARGPAAVSDHAPVGCALRPSTSPPGPRSA